MSSPTLEKSHVACLGSPTFLSDTEKRHGLAPKEDQPETSCKMPPSASGHRVALLHLLIWLCHAPHPAIHDARSSAYTTIMKRVLSFAS